MKRSSSTIRPLRSASFNKDVIDHKKTDDLPIIIPNNEKKPSKLCSNNKIPTQKSKRWFIIFIIFTLFMFGFILYRIFLTYTLSFTRRDRNKNQKRSKGDYSQSSNDPYANMLVDSRKNEGLENYEEKLGPIRKYNKDLSSKEFKKKSNLRRKLSEEELQLQYEYELAVNPSLEILDEEEIKEAIENGTIDQTVEEAEEIEEIIKELEETKREKKQKGFRGKNK
ncbi:hypothetical protein FG386_000422 [Cryptosporidium ryanae]|uniref:uncharacterized protein n=1 Tax=Cryptosporidium ryanae TaxID=515981 RepID=UPI00351A1585|nr:hypothetical protein FG386_000422 [Cryptosporidium ryanae]